MLENRLAASVEPSTCGVSVVGARAPARAHRKQKIAKRKTRDVPGPVLCARPWTCTWHSGAGSGGALVPRTGPEHGKKKKKKSKKNCFFRPNRKKTRAESHAIDATRHLYTLQYPVSNLSRLQMIHGSSNLALLCAPRECVWSWPEGYRNFNR